MIYLLIKSAFLGFGIWSVFLMLTGEKVNPFYKALDDASVVVFRIAGIAFMTSWICQYFYTMLVPMRCDRFASYNTMSETYRDWCWLYAITYIGATQILWFSQVKNSSILRFSLAIVILLILHLEWLMVRFTSYRRDFFPNDWMLIDLRGNLFLSWGINFGIFMCMIGGAYWIKKLRKK